MIWLIISATRTQTIRVGMKFIQQPALTFRIQTTAFPSVGSLVVKKLFNRCTNGTLADFALMVASGVVGPATKVNL
jgi:hypothetical protein